MAMIKSLVESGIDFAAAVKAVLGMSVRRFADECAVQESAVSALINGSTPYPYERERAALAKHLGVEREWLDEQLAKQRERALLHAEATP